MKKKTTNPVKVLVVDDSAESVELIRRNLESVGHHVYAASTVRSAVTLLESSEVDLLITDL